MNRRRLVCPKCGAKYEVDANLIPLAGRDVQCSNCGQTWFERRDATEAEPVAPKIEVPEVKPTKPASVEETLGRISELMAPDAPGDALDSEAEPVEVAPGVEMDLPEPPHLDDAVRNLLREEAERESGARANEGKRGKKAAGRAARAESAAVPPAAGSRRDLLPDIEEINSSLKSTQSRYAEELSDPYAPRSGRGSGFRKGFFVVVGLFLLCLLIYALADPIVAQFPSAETYMDSYVDWVDRLRINLDARVQSWIEALRSLSGDAPTTTL